MRIDRRYGAALPYFAHLTGGRFPIGTGQEAVVGICSASSPALMHLEFASRKYYTRTDGQIGVTSNPFGDLMTFTGPAGRTYVNAAGVLVTAGLNEPRVGNHIDIGAGLFNAGIQMEPGDRTNLIPRSQEFGAGVWIGDASVAPNTHAAPDGTLTADTITSTGGAIDAVYQSGSATDGQVKSIYARTVSGTGTAAILGHSSVGAALVTLTEEWQRFELPVDTAQTGGNNFYAVDFRAGTLTEVVLWGAQLEVGANATSYIGTETSPVTLAGEALQIDAAAISAAFGGSMPSAVSISIEGHMTYADDGGASPFRPYTWEASATVRIATALSVQGADIGRMFFSSADGASTAINTAFDAYSPGANVPFNIAARYGSGPNSFNAAHEGTVLTAASPAAIPNLIAQALQIVPVGIANIRRMTITADAYSDTNLVDATTDGSGFNPLCPYG